MSEFKDPEMKQFWYSSIKKFNSREFLIQDYDSR